MKDELDQQVGRSFSFSERWKMRGIGSPRMMIYEASPEIQRILDKDADVNYCNAELRTQGIIIRFQSKLETYGFIIPYYRLVFYQNGSSWSFHAAGMFLKVNCTIQGSFAQRFKMHILEQKSSSMGHSGPNANMN